MYELDKKRFASFVASLRKEKSFTQKELAEKLFVSDKAVSKWETGVSIPDTALLVPLAEALGVTVTELLMCERQGDESLSAGEVESVVKTAISYSENKSTRAYEKKGRWMLIYVLCLIAGGALTTAFYATGNEAETIALAIGFGAVFGAYFCFFVKTRLPDYYDSNRIGAYYDGPVRMNVPGVSFNNNNWPYIVRVGRIWSCAAMAAYPIICFAMGRLIPELWMQVELYVFLVLILGGLLVPIYIVGKKYQ